MSKRQVIILWIIAAVLASLVTIIKIAQKDPSEISTNRTPGEKLIESFPAADVAEITVKTPTATTTMFRTDSGWRVKQRDGYPADTPKVNEFLRTLEALEVTQAIEAGESFAPRFGMDPDATSDQDAGITVTCSNAAGTEIATITLGKNIQSKSQSSNPMFGGGAVGRYIRNHADTSGFYAIKDLLPTVQPAPSDWLDRSFFSLEKIKSITLSKTDQMTADWSITRESEEAEYQLAAADPGEVANTTTTSPLKSLFSYIRFEDVLPKAAVTDRAATTGIRTATIETFEGFTYTLTLTPDQSADSNMLLTLTVDAKLPETRKKGSDESEEDAATMDKAFDERLATLTEKLEKEKTFEGHTYVVTKGTVSSLLKNRGEMVTKAEAKKSATTTSPPIPLKP